MACFFSFARTHARTGANTHARTHSRTHYANTHTTLGPLLNALSADVSLLIFSLFPTALPPRPWQTSITLYWSRIKLRPESCQQLGGDLIRIHPRPTPHAPWGVDVWPALGTHLKMRLDTPVTLMRRVLLKLIGSMWFCRMEIKTLLLTPKDFTSFQARNCRGGTWFDAAFSILFNQWVMHRILQLLAISLALGAVSPAPLSNPLAGFNSDTEVSGHDRSNCALLLPREKQFVDYSVPSGLF